MSRKKYIFDLKFFDIVPRMMKKAGLQHYNELAELLDIKPQSINQFRVKNRMPSNQVINFAIKTNTSLDELFDIRKEKTERGMSTEDLQTEKCEGDSIFVPHWKGNEGTLILGRVLIEMRQSWIDQYFGENKKDLMLWTMNSDNMNGPHKDSVERDALVIIDKRRTAIDGSGVYAFVANGKIVIRRVLERVDGSVDFVSDNPAYHVQGQIRNQNLIPGETKVLGRVVFVGRAV